MGLLCILHNVIDDKLMGKLHTLRRAIEHNPEKWERADSAYRANTGQWVPSRWNGVSYKSFIKKVLRECSQRR